MCSMYAKFYKDLLKNNTFMAIKTSIPTCIFQHGRHSHFGEINSSSYFIAIMYTNVAQKFTKCFRKYKTPDKRSENPIHHTVCLIIQVYPQFIDENGKIIAVGRGRPLI